MAITYVGTSTPVTGSAALTTLALPTGWAANDVALLVVQTSNQSPGTITGWTQIGTLVGSGNAASVGSVGLAVYYKVLLASTAPPTVPDSGDHQLAWIAAWRGVDNTTPIHTSTSNTAASATAVTIPAVTTTIPNCVIIGINANSVDTNTTQVTSFTSTSSTLSSFATIATTGQNTTFGTGGGAQAAYGTLAAAGSSNTITGTQATASVQAHFTIALTPGTDVSLTGGTTQNVGLTGYAGSSALSATVVGLVASDGVGTGLTLSNSNLTATVVGQSGFVGVQSTVGFRSGKWFWSLNSSVAEFYLDPGISDGLETAWADSVHMQGPVDDDGSWTYNSAAVGGTGSAGLGGPFGPGIIDFAVDADAALCWVRFNGGNWNSDATANPATGTGGCALMVVGRPLFGYAGIYQNGALTANFGASSYTYAAPSGFKSLATLSATNVSLTAGTTQNVGLSGFTGSASASASPVGGLQALALTGLAGSSTATVSVSVTGGLGSLSLTGFAASGSSAVSSTGSTVQALSLAGFTGSASVTTPPPSLGLDLQFTSNAYTANGTSYGSLTAVPVASVSTPAGFADTSTGVSSFIANVGRRTDLGLLVEETSQNLLGYSNDATGSAWSKSGNSTVTANYTTDPTGGSAAQRFQAPASGVGIKQYPGITGINTISGYLRSNTGSAATYYWYFSGDQPVSLATTYQRKTYTGTNPSAVGWDLYPLTAGGVPMDAVVWGPQLETKAFATSYIANNNTFTQNTRAADNVALSVSPISGAFSVTVGFTTTRAVGQARTLLDWHDGTDSNKIILTMNSSNQLVLTVINSGSSTVIATEGGSPAAARSATALVSWTGSQFALAVNGTTVATTTASLPAVTSMQLGQNRALTQSMNDYLSRVTIAAPSGGVSVSAGSTQAVAISGLAGSITVGASIAAGLGSVGLTGRAGTLQANTSIIGNNGSLTASGYAGYQGSGVGVSGALAGSLSLSSGLGTAQVSGNVSVTGSAGVLTLTGRTGIDEADVAVTGSAPAATVITTTDGINFFEEDIGFSLLITDLPGADEVDINVVGGPLGRTWITTDGVNFFQESEDISLSIQGFAGTATTVNVTSIYGQPASMSVSYLFGTVEADISVTSAGPAVATMATSTGSTKTDAPVQAGVPSAIAVTGLLGSVGSQININVAGSTGAVSFTGQAGSSAASTPVNSATTGAVAITGKAAVVQIDATVQAGLPQALGITGQQGSTSFNLPIIGAAAAAIDLTGLAGSVVVLASIGGQRGRLAVTGLVGVSDVVNPAQYQSTPERTVSFSDGPRQVNFRDDKREVDYEELRQVNLREN